jgi:predicted protein tyrosine phosphatase
MILEHLSREKAEAYRDEHRLYAMISITDPDYPEANLQNDPNCVAVLRLAFHDFSEGPEELLRLAPDEIDHFVPPEPHHAREIVRFYRAVAPQIQKLVIHCEAGVSRSAAVGAAIAHCLRQSDAQFYRASHPNHRVRRLVIEAWEGAAH